MTVVANILSQLLEVITIMTFINNPWPAPPRTSFHFTLCPTKGARSSGMLSCPSLPPQCPPTALPGEHAPSGSICQSRKPGSSKSYSSQVFFGTGNHPFRFCLKYVPQNPMDYHHFTIKLAVWREFPIFSHIHFLGIKNFVPHPCFVCGEGFDKASWSSFTC